MSAENVYTPISSLPKLAEADLGQDTLTWDFSFPPSVDTERLVVNTRALGLVQRLAAFESSHISEYQGDRTTFTPTILGINANGTAIGGRLGKTQHADTNQYAVVDKPVPAPLRPDYFRSRSVHALNKAELVDQVVEKRRGTRRDVSAEAAWAEVVDAALGASLRSAAKQNLTERAPRIIRMFESTILGAAGGEIITDAITQSYAGIGTTGLACGIVWGLTVGASAIENKARYGGSLLRERKWSIMPYGGWQPDRYLATAALTHTALLVTTRK